MEEKAHKALKISWRVLALILAGILCVTALMCQPAAAAEKAVGKKSTTQSEEEAAADAEVTLEEQLQLLEESIETSDEMLEQLTEEAKVTELYIDTLDEKIGALNEQLTVLEEQITEYEEEADEIQKQIDETEEEAARLKKEIKVYEDKLKKLQKKFNAKYEAYCARMRAMYISGGDWSVLSALLTCKDLSGLMTRYEMIKAVSKNDGDLLQEIQEEIDEIEAEGSVLDQKRKELKKVKKELNTQKEELKEKQDVLESAEESIAVKKATLSEDRAESDRLYAELTSKNGMYSEYKNEDSELAAAVEKEISDLINGIITADEVTYAVTDKKGKKTTEKYVYTDVYSNSDAVLNMTYPVPGHYKVSCSFGKYSNGSAHTGTDFPCKKGSKVVAAQSGQVIKVKRLDYSYGYYVMIYHGTDSKGRSIVTLYAHNSSILVSTGQTVAKGDTIALSGSTGNSTGPHCHFELRINGKAVNAINYLSK